MEAPPAEEALTVAPEAPAAEITPASDAALQAEMVAEAERQIDA